MHAAVALDDIAPPRVDAVHAHDDLRKKRQHACFQIGAAGTCSRWRRRARRACALQFWCQPAATAAAAASGEAM